MSKFGNVTKEHPEGEHLEDFVCTAGAGCALQRIEALQQAGQIVSFRKIQGECDRNYFTGQRNARCGARYSARVRGTK